MTPAQKAWATRKARLAASVAAVVSATSASALPPSSVIVNRSWEQPVAQVPAVAVPVFQTTPVERCELVEISIDDSKCGSGRRLFVVLEIGERMVRLFSPSSLVTVVVARSYYEKYAVGAKGVKRSRVAAIIRRNRALADKVNEAEQRTAAAALPDGGADGVRALELLGG